MQFGTFVDKQAAEVLDFAAFFIKFKQLEENQLEVKVIGQNVERALKLLKREAEKEGLFRELKKRRFYEKPSVKKKTKQREAAKKRAKSSRFKGNFAQKRRPAS